MVLTCKVKRPLEEVSVPRQQRATCRLELWRTEPKIVWGIPEKGIFICFEAAIPEDIFVVRLASSDKWFHFAKSSRDKLFSGKMLECVDNLQINLSGSDVDTEDDEKHFQDIEGLSERGEEKGRIRHKA